jgi:hypothetical protein
MSPERLDENLVKTLHEVADKLGKMDHEEFIKMLDDHEPGEISYFLQGGIDFEES